MKILQSTLAPYEGRIAFEYAIPRMGRRVDVVLLIGPAVFVLEFKVGETQYKAHALDQVWDYALDLKNFHETSREPTLAPILVATKAPPSEFALRETLQQDGLLFPIRCNATQLDSAIEAVLRFASGENLASAQWAEGRYCPTPTIIEAAMALYHGHSVHEISRSDASAINLSTTSDTIASIIQRSRNQSQKSICFVTGVPGAGKTLVGLNIATTHIDKENELHSVFLSGNGPLVNVLCEALARDKVQREREHGRKYRKSSARSEVKMFIQNVHHFRDDCFVDPTKAPIEHVAIFGEAQRAWNAAQTARFMRNRKGQPGFTASEPEFLISCLDPHPDWAVVVCLVGGGQEINTGEAGISEWIESLNRSFPDWHIYISPQLTDKEYGAGKVLNGLETRPSVEYTPALHLAVSLRSFRAEDVSRLVKLLLDMELDETRETLQQIHGKYPIAITRDLARAKRWIRQHARGTERYGLVASSQAERLKPHAIDVRSSVDPIHWFLAVQEPVNGVHRRPHIDRVRLRVVAG